MAILPGYYNSKLALNTSFLISTHINAYRRGNKEVLQKIREFLADCSKKALYKYLAVLKPYGYSYQDIIILWNHYVAEFTLDAELPAENLFSYFNGFLSHRLYKIVESESKYKRLSNFNTDSHEDYAYHENVASRKPCSYVSDEDIPARYSGEEIINTFIRSSTSNLLSNYEKEVIDLKLVGHTYSEISELMGLSYKQTTYVYNKGMDKLKTFVLFGSNSPQNSTIF